MRSKFYQLLVVSIFVSATGFAAETEFSGEQLKLKKMMEDLFDASKKVNNPPDKAAARASIEGAMDWDKIAQGSLGDQWKKQSEANRTKFKNLLKEVVVKTAYSRMDTFWDKAAYKFEAITIKGNEGTVKTRFKVKNESFLLEYYFNKKNDKWSIYDIAYEEIRYSVQINEQITAFLKEKQFAGLLDKLKKRREELDTRKTTS